MSSEEEDENIPSVEVCQRLCEEFASITNTDTACAQFYLQDREWDLERSLNAFFEDRQNKGALRLIGDGSESEVVVVVDGSPRGLAAAATAVLAESVTSRAGSSNKKADSKTSQDDVKSKSPPSELKFITWNIDGLTESNLKLRTKAVCKIIKNELADIVFLQEVITESAEYIQKLLPEYKCIVGGIEQYFTMALLRNSTVNYEDHTLLDFPATRMGRNLMKINAKIGDNKICLLNTHLESTVEGATERKRQLKFAFQTILDVPTNFSVILAGDMNLREKELEEIGGLPTGIEDLWISCGKRKECAYTWDMTRNDNITWNGKFKPRCRFDRAYLHNTSSSNLVPKYFGLIGLERLLPHRCFPSDHWGIMCSFKMSY